MKVIPTSFTIPAHNANYTATISTLHACMLIYTNKHTPTHMNVPLRKGNIIYSERSII